MNIVPGFLIAIAALAFLYLTIDLIRSWLTPGIVIAETDAPYWKEITSKSLSALRQVSATPSLFEHTDDRGKCHRTLIDETYGWRRPVSPE